MSALKKLTKNLWVVSLSMLMLSHLMAEQAITVPQTESTETKPLTNPYYQSPYQSKESNFPLLMLYLCVFTGALYVLGRWAKKNKWIPEQLNNIKVKQQLKVGPKEKILLVELAGETLVLGVTSQQINLLKSFESNVKEPEPEKIPELSNDKAPSSQEFSQKLLKLLSKKEA
jgi:flagellar protein FliO/FliZ